MLKNAFVSSLITGFVFLLTFGATVAFGAESPSVAPPGGLTSPIFSGLSIGQSPNFSIIPGGTINSMAIKSDGVTFFTSNDIGETHDVTITNGFLQTNTLKGVKDFKGKVDNTLTISSQRTGAGGVLEPSSSISLLPSAQGGSVLVQGESLQLTGGDLIMSEDSNLLAHNISLPLESTHTNITFGSPVHFDEAVDLPEGTILPSEISLQLLNMMGPIVNPSGPAVTIGDGLTVEGNISMTGHISNYDDEVVTVNDSLYVNTGAGEDVALTVAGDANISEGLDVGSIDSSGIISADGGISSDGILSGQTVFSFGDGMFMGNVTASGFGKYEKKSSWFKVSGNSLGTYTKTCPDNYRTISCHIHPYTASSGEMQNYKGMYAYPSSTTQCKGGVYNGNSTSKYFYVDNICYNPSASD